MINEPHYDEDLVNLGYLNTRLGISTDLILSKSQNFGTLPNPPYYQYNTYMGPDGIYICIKERLIGEYNASDWTKASTYVNVGDAFTQGIITAGMLQAVNGGTNTAGLTGEGTGNNAIRFWAGSTYAGRGSAPFRVTQGGVLTATGVNISGAITATSGSISGGLITSGINAGNITTGTLSTDRLSANVITTGNLSAQNISANQITTGSMSAARITTGTMNAARINGGTIRGVAINIANRFGVTSSGGVQITGSEGFFAISDPPYHPWMSAIQTSVTQGGLIFRTGTSVTSTGSYVAAINADSNGNLLLMPNNLAYVNSVDPVNRIATSSSGPSSRNVKENIKKINEYDRIYSDLQKLEYHTYDYKYKGIKEDIHDFGFIIDEVEQLSTISKYTKHYDCEALIEKNTLIQNKRNSKKNFKYKSWDRDSYIKTMLLMIKSMQLKIDELEKKIEGGK